MKKGRVVLIALYDLNSFSIRTLHAVLEKAGFDVRSIFFKQLNPNNTMDIPSGDEIKALGRLIKELKPILVGISVRSTLFKLVCKITEEIKKEVNTLVLWGGIHPTIRPAQSIEFADAVCVGEGEDAIVEIAEKLSKDEKIDSIQNLWIKENGRIIKNDLRPLSQNLDLIPFADFSSENKYLVEHNSISPLADSIQRMPQGAITIMTSRGCPFSCTYCCNNILRDVYKGKGQYVRRRSVENVIEELVQAKERFKNATSVVFHDDVFTFDIEWITRFCEKYKKVIGLPFFCYCHPKATNEKIIRILKDAGVANMTMGIQAGCEKTRHEYFERFDKNEEIIRAAQILFKYKIHCGYDLIMDNPLETDEDRRETFNLLLKLPRPFELHTHTLTYFPETKFTKLLLGKGMIAEGDVEDQKQESYERWTPTLDLKRNKENLFWDNLYYLTQKSKVPQKFIIWLSHRSFLKKHPKSLTLLLRLMSPYIYTIRRGSKMDMARLCLCYFASKPYLLFKKETWVFGWTKIKGALGKKAKSLKLKRKA